MWGWKLGMIVGWVGSGHRRSYTTPKFHLGKVVCAGCHQTDSVLCPLQQQPIGIQLSSVIVKHSLRYNIGVFFVTFAGKNDDVSWRINNLEYEMGKRMTRKRARVACFMGHLARNCVRESAYLKDSFFLFLNDDRSLQGIVSIILACTNFILSSDHAKNSEYRYVKKVEG